MKYLNGTSLPFFIATYSKIQFSCQFFIGLHSNILMFDGRILRLWTPKYFQKSKIKGRSHFRNKIGVQSRNFVLKETFENSSENKSENITKNIMFTYCALLRFFYRKQTKYLQ